MQCTLFCTQGTCILIRTKKKQRRKILLSCTAFHHLLFSLFSSPYPCSCSFFFSSSFRISCTIFCATSQSCISDLILQYSNLSRRISGEKNRASTHSRFQRMSQTSVYKGYKQDKIEMRGDRAEMSDFPLYLNTVAGGLDRRDQTIGGFSFVVKIYAVPVVEIIG